MHNYSPLVSVVIPTYNRNKMLVRLIEGLLRSSYENIEIIVIDDASSDGTTEIINDKYSNNPKVRYYKNKKNVFASAAKNIGAQKAKGKYIFFIDDDNVVTKNLITHLVEIIDSDDTIAEVGPIMYFYSNKNKFFWAGTNRNMFTSKTNFTVDLSAHTNDKVWETDDILNSYMVRSSVVKKNNIQFDGKLGIMYEESDYAYRIRKLGYKIKVVKDAVIYHDTADTSQNPSSFMYHTMLDKRRPYYTARNRLIFHKRYSNLIQLLSITLFWNWLFAYFYIMHIFLYTKPGNFNTAYKLILAFQYLRGIKDGIKYILSNGKSI